MPVVRSAVRGDKQILRNLRRISGIAADRITNAGVKATLPVFVKEIRRLIPAESRHIRKTVKSSFRQRKGVIRKAKVGFGVGRNRASSSSKSRPRGSRPGVGISGNNAHWWVLSPTENRGGVKKRQTKKGANRGIRWWGKSGRGRAAIARNMSIVPRAYRAAQPQLRSVMMRAMRQQLLRELRKMRKGKGKEKM